MLAIGRPIGIDARVVHIRDGVTAAERRVFRRAVAVDQPAPGKRRPRPPDMRPPRAPPRPPGAGRTPLSASGCSSIIRLNRPAVSHSVVTPCSAMARPSASRPSLARRHQHQRRAVEQRAPDLERRGVERDRRYCGTRPRRRTGRNRCPSPAARPPGAARIRPWARRSSPTCTSHRPGSRPWRHNPAASPSGDRLRLRSSRITGAVPAGRAATSAPVLSTAAASPSASMKPSRSAGAFDVERQIGRSRLEDRQHRHDQLARALQQ